MSKTPQLTHFDATGMPGMVDVGGKPVTLRLARAEAWIVMQPDTRKLIRSAALPKGDVLTVARLAGIMAAKRTDELIPLCHSLGLDSVELTFEDQDVDRIRIESCVRVQSRTGVEMEALTAASVAALTIYDMCKAVDRDMEITGIRLLEKQGGKSGHYLRELK